MGRENPPWAECIYEPYSATFKNHPVAIWVRQTKHHYNYAVNLGLELCKEYTRRYKKQHKCYHHLIRLQKMGFPEHIIKETSQPLANKRATVNLPKNIEYFDCAIADEVFDECAVYCSKTGRLD